MAFPRRFKSATWYMRLSTGEVELVTPAALERAFKCGLADTRTPVREIGGHVWMTLGEAADIDVAARGDISSLAPMALDDAENAPAADLESGTPWQVRRYADPRSFRSSKLRAVGALLVATAAFSALAVMGTHVPSSGLRQHMAAANEAQEAQATLETTTVASSLAMHPAIEPIHPIKEPEERLTAEQKKKLKERDTAMREHGVGLPTSRSMMAPRGSKDPFANARKDPKHDVNDLNNQWDPLSGF